MATQTKKHTRSMGEYDDVEDALDDLKKREPFNQLIDIEESGGESHGYDRDILESLDYRELQGVAKDLDVKANQTTEELIEAILDADSAGKWIFTVKRSSSDFDLDE